MKKFFSLMVAMIAACVCFSCGGGGDDSSDPSDPVDDSRVATPQECYQYVKKLTWQNARRTEYNKIYLTSYKQNDDYLTFSEYADMEIMDLRSFTLPVGIGEVYEGTIRKCVINYVGHNTSCKFEDEELDLGTVRIEYLGSNKYKIKCSISKLYGYKVDEPFTDFSFTYEGVIRLPGQ